MDTRRRRRRVAATNGRQPSVPHARKYRFSTAEGTGALRDKKSVLLGCPSHLRSARDPESALSHPKGQPALRCGKGAFLGSAPSTRKRSGRSTTLARPPKARSTGTHQTAERTLDDDGQGAKRLETRPQPNNARSQSQPGGALTSSTSDRGPSSGALRPFDRLRETEWVRPRNRSGCTYGTGLGAHGMGAPKGRSVRSRCAARGCRRRAGCDTCRRSPARSRPRTGSGCRSRCT